MCRKNGYSVHSLGQVIHLIQTVSRENHAGARCEFVSAQRYMGSMVYRGCKRIHARVIQLISRKYTYLIHNNRIPSAVFTED